MVDFSIEFLTVGAESEWTLLLCLIHFTMDFLIALKTSSQLGYPWFFLVFGDTVPTLPYHMLLVPPSPERFLQVSLILPPLLWGWGSSLLWGRTANICLMVSLSFILKLLHLLPTTLLTQLGGWTNMLQPSSGITICELALVLFQVIYASK